MAHDVWLIRRTLITCLLLSVVAGIAEGTNKTLSTDQVSVSDIKDSASKTFPSHPHHAVVHHLIKKGLSKVEHKLKQRITGTVQNKSTSTEKFHRKSTSTEKFHRKSSSTGKFHYKSTTSRKSYHKSTSTRKINQNSTSTRKIYHKSTSTRKIDHKSTSTRKIDHKSTSTRKIDHKSTSTRKIYHKSTSTRKVHNESSSNVEFHHESTTTQVRVRQKSTELNEPHDNQATKRTEVERRKGTGLKKTRVQVLDSFFDHPDALKKTPAQESSLARSREIFQPALSLNGLYSLQNEDSKLRTTQTDLDGEVPAQFLDWSKKGFRNDEQRTHENEVEGSSKAEKYGKNSMEGRKIVNAASLVESSIESQGTGVTESIKYSGEKVSNRARAFQYLLPTNSATSSKRRSRYRYINSLIRPQLAGISADLNGLDAQRNPTKSGDFKALKNDSRFRELKLENQINEAQVKENLTELKKSSYTETKGGSKDNTKQRTEVEFHANDLFMLGTPDRSTYMQDLFLANPHPVKYFFGSGDVEVVHSKYKQQSLYATVRPTLRWQKLTATIVTTAKQSNISKGALETHRESGLQESNQSTKKLKPTVRLLNYRERATANQEKALNKMFDKFRGSGFQESINTGEEWDSDGSGLKPSIKVDHNLQLIHQTSGRLKPAPRVSLQSIKDEAMSHIKEQSKQGSSAIYSSGHGSSDTQKVSLSSYYKPTRVHGISQVTTVTSYKRTTISHAEFNSGYNPSYQSWTPSSGAESGSGEDDTFLLKHYHQVKTTPSSLSATRENHTGILGVTDKETKTKCEKMGKADYREKCPHGWLPFEQFCYLFVPHSKGKWEEFPQKCNDENALLAMPKTNKELAFLQDSISSSKSKTKYFYIGLKKKSGDWTWIDDMPYTRDENMTDKLGTNNCGALSKGGDIHMVSCNKPKAGYICELWTGVKALSILALGDSLTSGFHNDDKSRHTPYTKTLEYLLNKDVHKCYTLTTVSKDGVKASELSQTLETHLKNANSKYSWVVILAGTNDILHSSHTLNRKAWNIAMQHIIDLHITSHRFGAKTIAVTIPEMDCEESDKPPCQNTRLERLYINEKLRHYARTNEFTILCDLATKFPRYSLSSEEQKQFWEEGLHMKPAGYEKMAEIIYRDLLAHVDEEDSL